VGNFDVLWTKIRLHFLHYEHKRLIGSMNNWVRDKTKKGVCKIWNLPPPKEPPLEDSIVGELEGRISLCFVELPFDISYYHHKTINPNSI
jgi:hypothetical protein